MDTAFAATVVAVIEEGSIAAAARRLGLTPGAVALRVKTVEAELGATLIGRSGRRVAATPAAARLLGALRGLVDGAAELKRLASARTVAGQLRLGTIATASTGLLPPVLCALTQAHPDLALTIEPGTSIELCERVLDGALDAALVVEPPMALRKGEAFTRWVAEPLVLITPPSRAGADPLALLARETFIRYDRRNWGGRIVDRYLRTIGVVPRDRIELDALDGIVAMVSAGLGVAIIPDWTGPRPQGTQVACLPLPPPAPVRNVGIYCRSMSPRQDLIALLTETFGRSACGSPQR
ncbi:LysR family transcriptional regulator [Xanthobacter autotrophicus]|uniref:LysR substrate-binding domain-containing protein n=1 Tax=Xanthobacter TaxID=279 RepID=UPI0024AA7182|nr:LysR substrate-binding domain-containing protein [Xanthobacter autotrophicus]MDI4665500.1 LysR family transcriptional regulator [Xanthobacter autotrophicus]